MRETILDIVRTMEPYDALEREHIAATIVWIESGVPLCRIRKPADPPQHLVSYVAVCDIKTQQLLLVDHRNARLWLPTGGHVEPDEHPATTAERELREELGIQAQFVYDNPVFLTVTQTVGATAGHTDVSLWYVLHCDARQPLEYDRSEFARIAWFTLVDLPLERTDPHMHRFAAKLRAALRNSYE